MNTKANEVVAKLESLGYTAEVVEVNKNNGVIRTGICIRNETNVSPNVYFDESEDVYVIVSRCIKALENVPIYDASDFNWENIKNKLHLSLVNYDKNKDRGVCIKQIKGTDLGIIVKYLAFDDVDAMGFVTIKEEHLEKFGIDKKILFKTAENAFNKANDYTIRSMREVLISFGMPEFMLPETDEIPMTIVSNGHCNNGAVSILNKNAQNELIEKFGGNFYIIPSSIHELIVLPYDEEVLETVKGTGMISDVNNTQVADEEVLSNNLFYFDVETRTIKVA